MNMDDNNFGSDQVSDPVPNHTSTKTNKKSKFLSKLGSGKRFNKTNVLIVMAIFGIIGTVQVLLTFAAAGNLAEGKTTTSSSNESASYVPALALDGKTTTRWASASGIDAQWVTVDLGKTFDINRVVLNWEAAAGKNYDIQIGTTTNGPWTTMKTVTGNTTAGVKDYTGLKGNGRFIRVNMTARATQWGYSLWELEAYGPTAPPVTGTPVRYEGEKSTFSGCAEIKTVSAAGASGGTSLGWFGQAGCQTTFNVTASKAGTYTARIRYAMQPRSAGSTATIPRTQTVNGVTSTIQFAPSTTDNNNWWNVYVTKDLGAISLNEGANAIRFAIDSSATALYWDVDYLEVDSAGGGTTTPPPVNPPTVPPPATPTRMEAEAATFGGCSEIKTVSAATASGATSVGWFGQAGCQIVFSANAPTTGSYKARLRYAMMPRSAGSTATVPRVQGINNKGGTGQFAPSSTDPNNWYNVYVTQDLGLIPLNAGANTILFGIDSTVTGIYWDVDYLEVDGVTAGNPTTPPPVTPPPVVQPPSTNSPSGEAMPVGNLPGWKQIFTEDFTVDAALGSWADANGSGVASSAYNAKWSAYGDGWPDTAASQSADPTEYRPSRVVTVKGGVLNKYLHTENGKQMAAALQPRIGNQLYGRYTARFKSDPVNGYKVAWLLWPGSGVWPRDGEIDFPEGGLKGNIEGYMHRQNGTSGGDQDAFSTGKQFTSWHTYTIEWAPNSLKYILDGVVIGSSTSRVPNTPMHWVLQTESCMYDCWDFSASGNLQVDWVAAYSYNP